jgi:uncharacterized protein
MRWRDGKRSTNVEDRRGDTSSPMAMGGVGGGLLFRFLPMLIRGGGLKSLVMIGVVAIGAHMMGIINLPSLLGQLAGFSGGAASGGGTSSNYQPTAAEQEMVDFTTVVLGDTEVTWQGIFAQRGLNYRAPTLVFFSGSTSTSCGQGQAAMGPFYCPADENVYIDLSFYGELQQRFGAPGDFAQAYVIAHEVGHHIQTVLGTSEEVQRAGQRLSQEERNQLSVRQELQADCYAGVWGFYANRDRQILEPGDLQEALVAATAIGDDTLQRQMQGRVVPESFTHGSAEQRKKWLSVGLQQGNIDACDTFAARSL